MNSKCLTFLKIIKKYRLYTFTWVYNDKNKKIKNGKYYYMYKYILDLEEGR